VDAAAERGGLRVHSLNLTPNNGKAEVAELARQLDGYVRATFVDGESIDLVAFSMGGLYVLCGSGHKALACKS